MYIIGLTGPSGAGKTTALRVLESMGGKVFDCDAIYHELLTESGLDLATLQTCMVTLSASGLIIASGPGRFSASI